jgi:hypothetical protein
LNYWEAIANKPSKAGWSWGWVSAVDSQGRTIWIADAHRDDGKRFVVPLYRRIGGVNDGDTMRVYINTDGQLGMQPLTSSRKQLKTALDEK